MQRSSTADSAHVCTDPGKHWLETYFDPAYGPDRTGYAIQLAGQFVALQATDWRAAVAEARQIRFAAHLDTMCAAASARVQQCILQAASAAYIALGIDPPDCHVIDVLASIPGLACATLPDEAESDEAPITSAGIAEANPFRSSREASAETTDTRQEQTALTDRQRTALIQAWNSAMNGTSQIPLLAESRTPIRPSSMPATAPDGHSTASATRPQPPCGPACQT